MRTKIAHTIREWIPEAIDPLDDIDASENTIADYQILHKLAEVCMEKMCSGSEDELDRVQEIGKVINLLYQGGNLYTRNAIENEFLTTLSSSESSGCLKKHLDLFPNELRKEYIKTILEN